MDYVQFISQVGFPIFVATYLLIKIEKSMKELRLALENNTMVIDELSTLIKNLLFRR